MPQLKMTLRRPCARCPFRCDIPGYITPGRVTELEQTLGQGQGYFTCHETTVESGDDDGEMVDGPNAQHCAGALIMLEKMGTPTQLMRIFERFNRDGKGYASHRLDMDAPVYRNWAAMRKAMRRKPSKVTT